MTTVLYPEAMYPDDVEERRIFGPDITLIQRDTAALSELSDEDCAQVDGLMLFRNWAGAEDLARFPRLRAIVRMGVGYDRIDREAAGRRGITVCNVPDYGTTEVADHAISLALALRRGLLLNHEAQQGPNPSWDTIKDPVIRRFGKQGFGIVGLGRIGTAVALRAKALGFNVSFYDPHLPNGVELAIGIGRARSLEALLAGSDVLSIHVPHTRNTTHLIGATQFAALPPGAVVINTARGSGSRARARRADGRDAQRPRRGGRTGRDVGGTAGRTDPPAAARLPHARGLGAGAADRDTAFGVLDAGSGLGHPHQVGGNDGGGAGQ